MVPRSYPPTPVMSRHARERCAEMGISTKVAKRIAARPSLTYGGNPGTPSRVHVSDEHPEYAVVVGPPPSPGARPVVVTVLFREHQDYVRNGAVCILADRKAA